MRLRSPLTTNPTNDSTCYSQYLRGYGVTDTEVHSAPDAAGSSSFPSRPKVERFETSLAEQD